MADDTPLTPEERDLLAAELALGVLEGELRALALRLQIGDPDFREAVTAWQTRFEPLLHGYGEVEAPDLWQAIELRLPSADPAVAGLGVVTRIESHARAWRFGALGAGALAAALAAFLVFRAPPAPPAQTRVQVAQSAEPSVARLGEAESPAQFAANYDAATGELRVRTIKLPPSDLAPELWVIPADNVPRSLGLIPASGSMRVTLTPAQRAHLKDGVTLAVTMEPRDGAPHAAPSSTPIAAGQIHKI
ncbi:anti-sigma-K factor RskA [Sphingobium xanthum]|jgi:anti-sigma-K factor RskA|uniref:anti-sigma factor n=1 Tax=Sphingobium xanthum TaxID=1387165 RepID=UPI001C8BD4CA|nr:anti-sigma factor [Sphingobium xanthum]